MVTVTPRPDGTYAIASDAGPRYQVVTHTYLCDLIYALAELGMITVDGQPTRPAS